MYQADVLTLITETSTPRGVYDTPTESQRTVYCTIRSVGMTERYLCLSHGLNPEIVFVLAHAFEYQDEESCIFNSVEYSGYNYNQDGTWSINVICTFAQSVGREGVNDEK